MSVMRIQNEINEFIESNPNINDVDLVCMDIAGHFFGKRYPISQLIKFAEVGMKFPRAMPLMSAVGNSLEVGKYGLDDGDPDHTFFLVQGSLIKIPWTKTPRAQMIVSTVGSDNPLFFEPRLVLSKIEEQFRKLGYFPTIAYELEFYLIDSERTKAGLIKAPTSLNSGQQDSSALLSMDRVDNFEACLSDIINCCNDQRIATGALSAEMGPGQYELNLEHNKDLMLAADQCAAFRNTILAVAKKHSYQATFMAKPYLQEAGNGQHLHLSVYDINGSNILQEEQDQKLRYAIAGCLELLPASMAILAPNINSYRRFESENCVAVNCSWGYENRTAAIRIPESNGKNRRLEHRVSGADTNPYLSLATILASVLHGLEQQKEPPKASKSNEDEKQDLPMNLRDALVEFGQSKHLRKYLGSEFIDVYSQQKLSELNEFEKQITAREYQWYL